MNRDFEKMLNQKQLSLFQSLKFIKDRWVEMSLIQVEENVDEATLREQQNELIESVLYSVLEMIDGYDDHLDFEIDLIDSDTKQSLKNGIQLHDKWMDFLNDCEGE